MSPEQEAFYAQGELGLYIGLTVACFLCFVLGIYFVKGLWG